MNSLIREIYKDINKKDSAYYDIYYLTDTVVKFSINDDRLSRVIICSLRNENNSYNIYGFEKSIILSKTAPITRHNNKNGIKTKEEFWKWYSDFYNNINMI